MTIEDRLHGLRTAPPARVDRAVLLGTGLADGFDLFESPIGQVMVTFNTDGVSSVDLPDEEAFTRFHQRFGRRLIEARPPRGWDRWINLAIERGTPGELPIDLRVVTEFQRQVLEVTTTIPRGQVRTYGWLARRVGKTGATRAVGSTMARNPLPLIVPCHRVVRSDGLIGNYSLGGNDRKRQLLEHEGADPGGLEELAGRGIRFLGSDTTGVFCLPTCRHARRISDNHRVEFRSADEAAGSGFRPCLVCSP
jgi:O-6-methylguanine DNA methyltransferase